MRNRMMLTQWVIPAKGRHPASPGHHDHPRRITQTLDGGKTVVGTSTLNSSTIVPGTTTIETMQWLVPRDDDIMVEPSPDHSLRG